MIDKEIKQESSVPAQGRFSIVELAELLLYWDSIGYHVSSMSQLLSWSISLLTEILIANNKLPHLIESVAEANNILDSANLYQRSLRKKIDKKIATAIAFENLREEGYDPKYHGRLSQSQIKKGECSTTAAYNTLHKKDVDGKSKWNWEYKGVIPKGTPSSFQPFTGKVETASSYVTPEMIEMMEKMESGEIETKHFVTRAPIKPKMNEEEIKLKAKEIESYDKEQRNAMDEWLRNRPENQKESGDESC